MIEQNIRFPGSIMRDYFGILLNPNRPTNNIITLDNVEYIVGYLNPYTPGNKGSNIVLKLYEAQKWDEDAGYPDIPDLIMKICKTPLNRDEKPKSMRFNDEIVALEDCYALDPTNTLQVFHFGKAKIENSEGAVSTHRYYTMEYASNDLAGFLKINNPSLFDRVSLFLEICDSLKLIWLAGYYHRDIKPDNILFFNKKWKIGDLGLVEHRDNSFEVDEKGEWIGPRGWQSPETLNKFTSEEMPWKYRFDCKIDHQSDLYQLGKLFWYIIQGNCPEGGVDRADFLVKDDKLYQIIKPLLNNNKRRRTKHIDDLIKQTKIVFDLYYRTNPEFSLH
jgi:serine/threonine protein kinase